MAVVSQFFVAAVLMPAAVCKSKNLLKHQDSLAFSSSDSKNVSGDDASLRIQRSLNDSDTAKSDIRSRNEDLLQGNPQNAPRTASIEQRLRNASISEQLSKGWNVTVADVESDFNGLRGTISRQKSDGRWKVHIDQEQNILDDVRKTLEQDKYSIAFDKNQLQLTFQSGDKVKLCNFPDRKGDAAFNGQFGTIDKPHPTNANKWYVFIEQGEEFSRLPQDFVKKSMSKNDKNEYVVIMSVHEDKLENNRD